MAQELRTINVDILALKMPTLTIPFFMNLEFFFYLYQYEFTEIGLQDMKKSEAFMEDFGIFKSLMVFNSN